MTLECLDLNVRFKLGQEPCLPPGRRGALFLGAKFIEPLSEVLDTQLLNLHVIRQDEPGCLVGALKVEPFATNFIDPAPDVRMLSRLLNPLHDLLETLLRLLRI